MTLTLDISDNLKPDEAIELLALSIEEKKPVGIVILEAARDAVRRRREQRTQSQTAARPTAA
jgi:hypothetical protein